MARENAIAEVTSAQEAAQSGVITFAFKGYVPVKVNVHDFPEDVRDTALAHGFIQKLRDSYAGAKGDVGAAYEEFNAVLETLQSGKWTERKAGEARMSDVVAALVEIYSTHPAFMNKLGVAEAREAGKLAEFAKAKWDAMTDAQQKTVRETKEVSAIVERLRAERAAARKREDVSAVEDIL